MPGGSARRGIGIAPFRWRRRLAAALLPLTGLLLLPAVAGAAKPAPFGNECVNRNGVLFCPTRSLDDRVPSFDGAPLDVDVTLPLGYRTQRGPLPTIVMLHGYGGDKDDFESGTPESSDSTTYHYNNNFYAKQGYAVVNYTARGFGRSCGAAEDSFATPECAPPTRGYIHLADQRWEARDSQYLLGLLADEGIADPDAIGVTGISYGGGQSTELAYLRDRIRRRDGGFRQWRSPQGEPLEISAAYPRWPWSDLVSSLLPNGRFLDSLPPSPKGESRNPLGIAKESYVDGLFALGLQTGTYCNEPPYTPCTDETANLSRWYARVQAGEPYTLGAERIADEIYNFHQGYGIRKSDAGVAPLLLQSGWTDDLFPPKESIRVYNDVLADDPDADVSLQLADLGHARASNKENSDRAFSDAAADFFARELAGPAGGGPTAAAAPRPASVTAYTQTCPQERPANGPFRARSYDRLGKGTFRFSQRRAETVTAGGGNPATGLAVDPIVGGGDACREVPEEDAPGTAVLEGPVSRGFTLLGLPTVTARIDTTGPFGQLDSRLWDVAPDGRQTLVSRGAYRLENGQDGRVRFQLHGNGYCLPNGHVPKLELLGQDTPYLRPSNSAFSVEVSNVKVRMPTAEREAVPALQLEVEPRRTSVGEPTRFRFRVTSREAECATGSRSQPDRSVPVRGARVSFGGVTERTDAAGRLALRGRFSEAGNTTATATKPGYRRDEARVRVVGGAGGDGGAGEGTSGGEAGGGSGGSTGSASSSSDGTDVDCPAVSKERAQDILDVDPSDPNRLDADDDGEACDLGAGGGATAGGGGLPFTGLGLAGLLLGGAALAASGALLRRRLGLR